MIAVLAMLAPPFAPLPAQSAGVAPSGAFEVWGGLGSHSPQWGLLGDAPAMNLGLIAVRWSHALGAHRPAGQLPALEFNVDVIPYARMSPPLVSLRGTGQPCRTASLCVLRPPSGQTGFFPEGSPAGFGLNAFGLTRRFFRDRRISPFVGATAGGLWFDQHVPTTRSSQFNFTASTELGLRVGPVDEPSFTFTYRFHHLSNGGTAGENPGLASHLFTVGIHRPRFGRVP
jgi:hypothetical protein